MLITWVGISCCLYCGCCALYRDFPMGLLFAVGLIVRLMVCLLLVCVCLDMVLCSIKCDLFVVV